MNRTASTVAIAASVVMALGLTACGGGTGDQAAKDTHQTLTVWAMGEEGKRLQQLVTAYEKKNPHITVKVTPVGWDTVHQKMVAAAAAGKLPDMAQMGTTMMGEFIELDTLEPVDTKTFAQDDFFPAAWDTNVVDDTAYGVPWYVDTRVLYYRTDLAEKAGVDKAPATWKELRDLAAAYQDKAGSDWGLSLQPGGIGAWQTWLGFLFSNGGELLDEQGKPALNSPEAVESLAEYAHYFDKGLSKKSAPPGYDVIKDFGSDRVPMFISGPWMVQGIADQHPQLKGKWEVVPLPAQKSSTSFVGGSSLVTFKDSAHKAAAKDFTAFLTSPENQAEWYEIAKVLPAHKAAWDQPALQSGDATLKVFEEQLKNSREVPALASWTEFSTKIDEALQEVSQRGADPRKTADKLQASTEDLVN